MEDVQAAEAVFRSLCRQLTNNRVQFTLRVRPPFGTFAIMFVRFVHPARIEGMDAREGFFCAAYDLRDNALTDQHTLDRVQALLSWFRQNLEIPYRFNRTKSKGAFRRNTKGLSWFRPEANVVLGKSYELVALLQENGYEVETLRSDRIGYIVYEDAHQVIAEPFADTPR